MAHWEYKVITSGKGGFATPALMEKFLNDLGKEEWEILSFHTQPDNPLAFHGLARRSTQREWTLEDAAAAAKAEADKVRAEFAAKFAGMSFAPGDEKPVPPAGTETPAADDGLRKLRDTERDHDPEALAEEASEEKPGDWDEWPEEDELPTFFEAVKPHLRRNQRGPGQSVAIDYLAKRWEQRESDIVGALVECGLTVPETDDAPPEYFEFEGDLYWLNRNQRGQLFLNVREKPRPVFRIAAAKRLDPSDPVAVELAAEAAAETVKKQESGSGGRRAERERAKAEARAQESAAPADTAPDTPAEPLPAGEALLDKLRPLMRRNRRGPGFSGSTGYLAKALKQPEADLVAALAALGLVAPEQSGAKPEPVAIGANVYWLNKDGRGGIWINGRERREGDDASKPGEAPEAASAESAEAPPPAAEAPASAEASAAGGASDHALAAVRLLLKPNKRGSGFSGELGYLARTLAQPEDEFQAALAAAGLAVPADSEAKPVFVELGDEILWINRNAKDGSLWLNAKAKPARKGRGGGRKKAASKPEAAEE